MLSTIDRDPWRWPYRIVLNKLRLRAPPLTVSMESKVLEQTLSALFPRDSGETTTTEALVRDDSYHAVPITSDELGEAIKRMTDQNAAPGPDGILGKAMSLALSVLKEDLEEGINKCLHEGKMPISAGKPLS